MKCPQCGAEAAAGAAFCQACGAALAAKPATATATAAAAAPAAAPGKKAFNTKVTARGGGEDPEHSLWEGSFSKLAMMGSWIGGGVVSLAVIIYCFAAGVSGRTWAYALTAVAVLWIVLALRLIYMQLSVHYRLTSQRFVHERGLLWRQQDRIETIDIDDVTVAQGPVQRMLGIGTVRLTSSDRSTPEFVLAGIENVRQVAAMIDEARRNERRKRGVHIESI
jgi:membrane protein YdbS with pleckstrin-like domain